MNAEDVALAEYSELKTEQRDRIKARDGYMYTTLAAIFVVTGAAVQAHLPALLLAVTPVCAVLGWTRLRNDLRVVELRRYFRDVTAKRLGDAACEPVLAWESVSRRNTHKWIQLAVDVLTFFVPGAVGSLVVVIRFPALLIAGWVDGVVAAAVLAVIVLYADLGGARRG